MAAARDALTVPQQRTPGRVVRGSTTLYLTILVGVLAAVVGVVAAVRPTAALASTIGFGALVLAGIFARYLPRVFLLGLGVMLVGYAFLGRGFAYVGIAPIFVGEGVLALGLLALALTRAWVVHLRRSPILWLLIAFGLYGAIRTMPYVGTYGLDALRDAVIWGYSVFAICVAVLLPQTRWLERVPQQYQRWSHVFLIWIPIAITIQRLATDAIPKHPGTDVPILALKPGDLGVHLGGVAAFALIGFALTRSSRRSLPDWLWWLLWLVGLLPVAAANRGGLLSALAAIAVVTISRPTARLIKPALAVAIIVAVMATFDVQIDAGSGRQISVSQLASNLQSITSDSSTADLSGTKEWRLDWWNKIVGYTIFGDYFWTGKGFGINLAEDDGFLGHVESDLPLRSPHNGHLTVLARMGVPGLVLWILLQGAFGLSLVRAFFQARKAKQAWWANAILWTLAYWGAFLVNASFDVFLEGPQGGIWFWTCFGFGVALVAARPRAEATMLRRDSRQGDVPGSIHQLPVPQSAAALRER